MYADDLLILSPSVSGLQYLLDYCYEYGQEHDILFNPNKSVCLAAGVKTYVGTISNMYIGHQEIQWVKEFKYLGVNLIANKGLEVNAVPITRKFYAALNSVLCRCKLAAEPVKLQLIKSFCLPLLSYCIGAVELKNRTLADMAVCWNDAFRKIFHFNRFESVKELMYFCSELDFQHLYDLARINFLHVVCTKFKYVSPLYNCLEAQFHLLSNLKAKFQCSSSNKSSWRLQVAAHFAQKVLDIGAILV